MSFLPPTGGADDRKRRAARGSADDGERATDGAADQDHAKRDHSADDRAADDRSSTTGPPAWTDGSEDDTTVLPRASAAAAGESQWPAEPTKDDRGGDGDPQRTAAPRRGGDRPEASAQQPGAKGRTDSGFDEMFSGVDGQLSRVERRRASRAEETAPTHGIGTAVGFTALGVIPGLGLTLTQRRRKLGIALLALLAIGIALLVWYLVRNDALSRNGAVSIALDWISQPNLLRIIWVGLIVGGVLWIGSVVLTAVTARPRPMNGTERGLLSVFTVALCFLVALPVVRAMQYIDTTESTASEVFAPPSASGEGGGGGSGGGPGAPNLEAADPWEHVDRVNMLLIGSDAGDSREGVRPDSMIVVSVDTVTGDAVLIGIPRNLQNAPIPADLPLSQVYPDGYNCGAECLINGVWTAAVEHSDQNPDLYEGVDNPGLVATQQTVSAVIGQPIQYTVLANLDGFADLVNAMGGVEINVQERLPMGGQMQEIDGASYMVPGSESGWLEPGEQRLNGYETLWYARSRVTTDDFSRMRRQRCVVAAIVDQVDPGTMLSRFREIMTAAGENIRISIPRDELGAWATLVERVQDGSMRSQPLTPQNVNVVDPDYNGIHVMVAEALAPVEEPEPTETPTQDEETSTSEPTEDVTEVDVEEPAPEEAEETEDTSGQSSDDLADVQEVC